MRGNIAYGKPKNNVLRRNQRKAQTIKAGAIDAFVLINGS